MEVLTDVCSKQCFSDALVYEAADDSDLIEGFIVDSVNIGMISSSLGLGDSSRKTVGG